MLLLYLTCWAVSRCDKKYELTLNILNWVSRTLLLAQLIDNMTSRCTILEKLGSYLQTKNCPELLAGIISPHEFYSYQSTALFIGLVQYRKWFPTANDPETTNDSQNGPQMILDRKWSPKLTANDPERKIGMA